MSDQTSTDLREEVRSRYAAAARAVLEPEAGAAASCCGSSAADSCCGTEATAAEAVGGFSEGLYREGETDALPEDSARYGELRCPLQLSGRADDGALVQFAYHRDPLGVRIELVDAAMKPMMEEFMFKAPLA